MSILVSIITPSYNSSKYIEETIRSVQSQTFKEWEMIIVDDCSTDNTIDIVEQFILSDNRIKLFENNTNLGAAETRNLAIKKSKGRYIAFLDSDDVWLPNKLEKQLLFIEENNLSFTYSAYYKIDEEGNKKGVFYPPKEITFENLLKTCSIGCLTAIYDTNKLGKVYMPNIRKRQDYALWLIIFRKIQKTKGIVDQPLAYYRVRRGSISSNKFKAAIYHYKVLRNYGSINFIKSIYYFVFYLIKGVAKSL